MRSACIIPARGGSTRIPKKNIRHFLGKPMLEYPIETAKVSGLFGTDIWVSTEDVDIARVAFANQVKVHPRSAVMAENGVGTQEVIRNAILEIWPGGGMHQRPELICCIYPCTPTLWPSDLKAAHEALVADQSTVYVMVEGMIYFGRTEAFLNDEPLEGEAVGELEECYRWLDINTLADWDEAERIFRRMLSQ